MDEIEQKLAEKTVMFWIRMALRGLAWITLLFMVFYRIIKPVIHDEEVTLTSGDKEVFVWCFVVLLSIEIIKKVFDLVIKKYFTK